MFDEIEKSPEFSLPYLALLEEMLLLLQHAEVLQRRRSNRDEGQVGAWRGLVVDYEAKGGARWS